MTKTVRIRIALLSLIAVTLVTITLFLIGSTKFNTPNRYELVQLDKGWTITRGSIKNELPSLQHSNIGVANEGDVIIIENTLPDIDLSPGTVSFRTVLASAKVYVDDELIYCFGEEFEKKGLMLPKTEHFIQLPEGFQGKHIKIELTSGENNAFSGLSPVIVGNYNDIKNNLVQSKRLPMVVGVYLCHLGFMLLILAPFLAFAENHDFSIFISGITSVLIGVYILCYNDIFWYISDVPVFYTVIEYVTLFLIPASILGFIMTGGHTKFRRLGMALLVLNLIFAVSTTILHVTNVIHICHFVPVLHVLGVLEGVFIIVSLALTAFRDTKSEKNVLESRITSTNTLIMGLMIFLGCSVVDILKFNIMKYSRLGEVNAHINFTTIGALVFVMSLLLNYFYHCIEYINESTIKPQLEGLAYTDALTELSNRSKCELVFAELHGDYTIISLDLDYLKYTNDNYGHDQGDILISGFAEILRNSFTDASLIGRMGGDEFLVILPFVDEERTERDLRCFNDLMEHRNKTESRLRFSASYGYATSLDKKLDAPVDAQKVYLLADKRMYAMKNQHHKQSLGRLYDDLLNSMLDGGKKQ